MNTLPTILALIAILIAPTAIAAENQARSIDGFVCKEVMRERGPDRDVAIAFLHGFLLGKSGQPRFELEKLRKESDAFIERCLENPAEPALEAMIKAKG